MTSSSPIKSAARRLWPAVLVLGLGLVAGCIADAPEDSNLPWSSNRNWEGMAPVAPQIMNRYD